MTGTEWTAPGQGATMKEHYAAIVGMPESGDARFSAIRSIVYGFNFLKGARTNLRLTGAPLTASDLARIAECEVAK